MTTTSPTQRAAPTADPPRPAARARWLMLRLCCSLAFMALLDVTIVNVAMPDDQQRPARLRRLAAD